MESSKLDEKQVELIKCIIEQNWLHARHAESNLSLYNNVFFSVVTAVLVYLATTLANPQSVVYYVLLLFLSLLSVCGLLITLKLSAEFKNHVNKIKKVLDEKATDVRPYMAFPLDTGIWKYVKVKRAFIILYVATLILWIFLFFYSLFAFSPSFLRV